MTPSTAIQLPLEAPTIELPGGVNVFASRDGDHVTGRATFPYPVSGRSSVEISYFNAVPIDNRQSTIDNPLDAKALSRKAMVLKWRTLCESVSSRVAAKVVGVSVRSLQLWARKLDTEGESGLADRYEPAPRKILSLDAALAKDAITVCAWWAFRVANVDCIDSKMMHSAALLRPRAEYMRDILGAIDAYYAWPTDRAVKYPFKTFARWAKYDFEKWLFRACAVSPIDNRQSTIVNPIPVAVPLQPPLTVIQRDDSLPDSKTRQREVRDFYTRRAIAALAHPDSLKRPSGSDPPKLIPDILLAIQDHYQWMLIRAARGDADALKQAVVTMPIWWDQLPEPLRNNIDARADAWKLDHPSASHYVVSARKLAMLGPSIRRPQKGPVSGCELLNMAV